MSIEAGVILRETREQKGVSIKDASDALHIRIPYLQALESGRPEIIPSSVQARGFLRIYSEYLGLNAADVIQEWDNPGSSPLSVKADTKASGPSENHVVSQQQAVPSVPPVPGSVPYTSNTYPTNPQSVNNFNKIPQYRQNPPQIPVNQPAQNIIQNNLNNPNPAGSVNFQDKNVPSAEENKPAEAEKTKEKQKKKNGISLFRKKTEIISNEPVKEVSAQDLFSEIGNELSNRRKFLSLSLEDCESQTLIRSIYLDSMETGNFEQLPSLIQARGMLNNYASFLDLDVDSIMLKFATALQILSEKKNKRREEKKHKPTKTAGRLKKFFTPDLFVGVFVIVGIAGIIIYSAITITAYRRGVTAPTPDLGISLLEQYIDTTRTPDFLPTASPTVMPATQIAFMEFEVNEPTEEPSEIVSSQPVQIFVNANQRALMTVVSDGKEVFSGRTLPNNTYPFDAENLIELTVSNGDAVSVVYNQQNLGRLGKLGEVVTINFSQLMAATPTPQFSPTPTNTYEPTYTPQPETPLPTNTPTPYIP